MQQTWVQSVGQEDSPGEGNGYPLQYVCLENSMDRGAWLGTVHGATKIQVQVNHQFYKISSRKKKGGRGERQHFFFLIKMAQGVLFIYLGLCCVFVAAPSFLQVQCVGFSVRWLLLWATSSRVCILQQLQRLGSAGAAPRLQSTGSVVATHGLSCSTACGTISDQELNPCVLHWQMDSLPLSHQRSPQLIHFCQQYLFNFIPVYLKLRK